MPNPKTNNLELDLIDRTSPTTTYLNLQTNLDDNWQKIDAVLPLNTMSRQAIINGNFDVCQRGTSFVNPVDSQYTADRWQSFFANSGVLPTTITHSREILSSGDIQGSYYFYRINSNGAGSGFGDGDLYGIRQRIENATRYLCGSGKKVTVSFYARSNILGKRLGIGLRQKYGSGGSPSAIEILPGKIITLTSAWTKYSVTFTTNTLAGKTFGANNDDHLQLEFYNMWGATVATNSLGGGTSENFGGSGNIDIAQIALNSGDQALPFQPRSFAEELALCQRYYEKSYNIEVNPATVTDIGSMVWSSVGGNYSGAMVQFKARKRVPPTIAIFSNATGAVGKIRNVTTAADLADATFAEGEGSFKVQANNVATAVNDDLRAHWTADAEL